VIASFRHKGLRELFEKGSSRSFRPDVARKLLVRLDFLNRAKTPADMNLPGFRFHALKGDRAGTYAVDVTGNYRLTFLFKDGDATDVDYEDYH
jgi:proteic killer suppression protein